MSTVIVIAIVVVVLLVLFLRLMGSEGATKRTMLATYYTVRESLGPNAAESDVLRHVLKTRPPFNTYFEDMLNDIVEGCPDIQALTAFVIGFDKQGYVRR